MAFVPCPCCGVASCGAWRASAGVYAMHICCRQVLTAAAVKCCVVCVVQGVTRLCWHPHQPLVFTACLDGIARCWDLRTAVCVRQYTGHTDAIQDIAVSPDGSMILTGSDDHTARVFQTI